MTKNTGEQGRLGPWPASRYWLIPAIAMLIAAGGIGLCVWFQQQTLVRDQGELLNQALRIARSVRHQELKTLALADRYRETPEYERLSSYLATYANAMGLDRAECLVARGGQFVRVPESAEELSDRVAAGELLAEFRSDDHASRRSTSDRANGRLTAAAPIRDPGNGDLLGAIRLERALATHPPPSGAQLGPWLGTFVLVVLLLAVWGLTLRWGNAISGVVWRHEAALACAAIGLAVTVGAAWLLDDAQRCARSTRFRVLAETHAAGVADEFRQIALELESLSLLFQASDHVDHSEFRACTEPLVGNYVTAGWAWIAMVPADSAADFEQQMQREGLDGWTIWQRDSHGNRVPAEGRDVLFPITYLEPATAIGRGVGFDVRSDPVRRAVIEQALRTAMPTATPPVSLVTFDEPTQGIILFQPAASRKQRGFVSTTLRLGRIVRPSPSIMNATGAGLAGGLFLLQMDQPPQFVASSDPDHAGGPQCLTADNSELLVKSPVFAWGRTFLVAVHPQPAWLAANPLWGGWAIALTGIVLTGLSTALVGAWTNRRGLLERQVELRTAELQEAQRIASLGHWCLDLRSGCSEWSKSLFDIVEVDPADFQLSRERIVQLVHPEDRERFELAFQVSASRRTRVELEHRIVLRDGRIKWLSNVGHTDFDAAGKPLRQVGTVQDITDRKSSEVRRELVTRVLTLLNEEQELDAFAADLLSEIRSILGLEAIAIRMRDGGEFPYFLQYGYPPRFIEQGRSLCRSGEFCAGTQDDSPEETSKCICGDLLGGLGGVNLPSHTPHGSFWSNGLDESADRDGTTPDPAIPLPHCASEGYRSVALVPLRSGDDVKGLLQVHDRRPGALTLETVEFLENLGDMIGIGLARRAAHEQLQKNHAETQRLLAHAEQMRKILLGLLEDQKAADEERALLQAKLAQSQKMESIGRLAGGIAHDFNNMLQAILGYTELVIDQLGPDHPVRAELLEIERAARRSADLTRQLLAFARKQVVTPKVLDLNETISSMIKILQRLIGEDIRLLWQPGRGLWPIKIDPSQVDQILANLAVNARDAIAQTGTLTIATENTLATPMDCPDQPDFVLGPCVLLTVRDSGCGMDEATRAHAFEPFFTTKSFGTGTGLGLATVFGIVAQNRGCIQVESQPGQGTTFRIYFPRSSAAAESSQATEHSLPARGRETILLVEDEIAILEMAAKMLESLGYRVLRAATPAEAIRLAQQHRDEIQLLVTDLIMPGMGGRELCAILKAQTPDLRYVFITGYSGDRIERGDDAELGAHLLAKPFTCGQLARKVRETLDK
ncbi:MAG: CHASE domain-containing protein [Pirellulaceae bacterium]|nr:CHASE domain-containing protein [Pirellulaceae bacterium]